MFDRRRALHAEGRLDAAGLDRAVATIADPARDAQSFGFNAQSVAIADALYQTDDANAQGDSIAHPWPCSYVGRCRDVMIKST